MRIRKGKAPTSHWPGCGPCSSAARLICAASAEHARHEHVLPTDGSETALTRPGNGTVRRQSTRVLSRSSATISQLAALRLNLDWRCASPKYATPSSTAKPFEK
eukprot:5139605-Prymnesium_polylepis.1